MTKDLAYYKALPYTRVVSIEHYDDEKWYVVEIAELPALTAAGKARQEAFVEMDKAFDAFIEANLEWNAELPEPGHKVPRRSPETILGSFKFSASPFPQHARVRLTNGEPGKGIAAAGAASFVDREYENTLVGSAS